jgi:hypothetical protein
MHTCIRLHVAIAIYSDTGFHDHLTGSILMVHRKVNNFIPLLLQINFNKRSSYALLKSRRVFVVWGFLA